MPNYVKTNLKFIGASEDIKKIKYLVFTEEQGKTTEFDFRKIVPYPTKEECPKEYLLDESLNVEEKWDERTVISNEKAHIQVMEDYPYLDWYEWQRDKWGTKWNACEPSFYNNEVWFDTAWSFCEPIVIALSKMFPDVRIEFQYADEDIGSNCDYGWCQNGTLTYANINGEAKTKLAIDLWDCVDDYEFKNGKWVYKDF